MIGCSTLKSVVRWLVNGVTVDGGERRVASRTLSAVGSGKGLCTLPLHASRLRPDHHDGTIIRCW